MSDSYSVSGRGPVDLADGRTLAPGDVAEDVDADSAHNRRLIASGRLVLNGEAPEPTKEDLLLQAESLGLKGLKSKTKDQIATAIEEHNAADAAGEDK